MKTWLSPIYSNSLEHKLKEEKAWQIEQQVCNSHSNYIGAQRDNISTTQKSDRKWTWCLNFSLCLQDLSHSNISRQKFVKNELSFQTRNGLGSFPRFTIHFSLLIFLSQSCLFGMIWSSWMLHKSVTMVQVKCFVSGIIESFQSTIREEWELVIVEQLQYFSFICYLF